MKKQISYWNAIITHILTTGFMTVILTVLIMTALGTFGQTSNDTVLMVLLYFIVPVLIIGAIALSTHLSVKYMRKYETSNIDNVINFSSIIAFVAILLWQGLNLIGIAVAAIGTLCFYAITKKLKA